MADLANLVLVLFLIFSSGLYIILFRTILLVLIFSSQKLLLFPPFNIFSVSFMRLSVTAILVFKDFADVSSISFETPQYAMIGILLSSSFLHELNFIG